MQIQDGKNSDPGWKKVGSGINIPDPQHWQNSSKIRSKFKFLTHEKGLLGYITYDIN
jgi:hypothetical protein